MQKSIPWSYRPYKPFLFESGDIYVCRIAPEKDHVCFEWLGDENAEYTVYFGKRDCETYTVYKGIKGCSFTVNGLKTDTDYKFYIEKGSQKSRVRLARTGAVPGTVINYLHPEDKAYSFSGSSLCSPSFVRHPDGYLLSSMDVFESGAPQNLTLIFRSDDDGKTWRYVTDLFPCFWGKLFIHNGDVYMFAISNEYGDLLIGKSTDGGKTFPAPSVILRGSCNSGMPGVHKNPQNVLVHNGRIYLTCEWGAWKAGYHAAMIMSCSVDDDLLDCDNWSITPPVKYDESWEGVAVGPSSGCIEGTPVIAPNGTIYNIMRYDTSKTVPNYGLVLAFEVNTEDHHAPLKYSHAIKLPGNLSKFMIRKDERTGY